MFPKYVRRGVRTKGRLVSAKHRKRLAALPCVCCLRVTGNPPHHLLRTGEHGTGRKSGDNWCIPMCDYHHRELHRNGDEVAFFENYNIKHDDMKNYALKLWDKTHGK